MNHVKKSNGFTLIEVLASIVILSIVIVSFLSFFPQMSLFNEKTKDNLDAVTIAKELLVEMKLVEYTDIIDNNNLVLPTDPSTELLTDSLQSSSEFLVLSGTYREKNITVTINRTEETYLGSNLNKHEMRIEIFESLDDLNPSSTIFGYIKH
ncbi:type IV pilus modification PilV family protein [Chungangia koreensis]